MHQDHPHNPPGPLATAAKNTAPPTAFEVGALNLRIMQVPGESRVDMATLQFLTSEDGVTNPGDLCLDAIIQTGEPHLDGTDRVQLPFRAVSIDYGDIIGAVRYVPLMRGVKETTLGCHLCRREKAI